MFAEGGAEAGKHVFMKPSNALAVRPIVNEVVIHFPEVLLQAEDESPGGACHGNAAGRPSEQSLFKLSRRLGEEAAKRSAR
jgi:hypothetical protein